MKSNKRDSFYKYESYMRNILVFIDSLEEKVCGALPKKYFEGLSKSKKLSKSSIERLCKDKDFGWEYHRIMKPKRGW